MILVVETLTSSMVVEILALLVNCKSRPLESCISMFVEVMSINCDSLTSLLSSVSFPSWVSFKGGILKGEYCRSCCCEKMNCKIVALYTFIY